MGAAALLAICATLVTGSALAAVGGEYTINGLPTGEYKLQFEGAAVGNYLPQYYPGKANFGEATALALAAPAQVSGVNASLLPGGQINGKVTSAEGGAPIAGIFVCATGEGLPEECAETNAAGEYTIVALQTGAYIVTFFGIEGAYLTQYYNAQFSETKAESVTVNEGTTTFGIDAVMQTPATDTHGKITGKVVEAGAETPLEGVEACAFAEIEETEEEVERCAITPASGEYTLAGLPSGKYEVFFLDQQNGFQPQLYKEKSFSETPTFVKVEVGHTKPEINAKLKKGATISGTVMSAAGEKPISQILVCANGVEIFAGGCALTDGAGNYQIPGLPSGKYKVGFIPVFESIYEAQWFKEQGSSTTAEPVEAVAPGTVTGINGKLLVAGQITGKVTAAVSGAAIAKISVCTNFGSCGLTNAEGDYAIVGLPASSYKVKFAATREGQNFVGQTYAEEVEVKKGVTVTGINAVLQQGGHISGVVFSAATEARLEGVRVCAYTLAHERIRCARTRVGKEEEAPQVPPKEQVKEAVKVAPKPQPNSAFGQAKAPRFNAKTATITFSFSVAQAGAFHWSLFFKNADVGFADALGVRPSALYGDGGPAAAAVTHKCRKGQIRHKGKCKRVLIPFGSGSHSVAAGTVQIKVKASSKALRALTAGHTLHVSGTFTFQSSLGGNPVAHTISVVVRVPKKNKKH